jgi:hypothetical protein
LGIISNALLTFQWTIDQNCHTPKYGSAFTNMHRNHIKLWILENFQLGEIEQDFNLDVLWERNSHTYEKMKTCHC